MNDGPKPIGPHERLVQLEQMVLNAFAEARGEVTAMEESLRVARAEIEKHQDEALTETQVAKIMQCSLKKIQELRKAGEIQPSCYLVSLPRYWRSELPQIFAASKRRRRFPKAA